MIFVETARDFATESRRRLMQLLVHSGSRSQGILGAHIFVLRPKTLPLHSGKAKRVTPSVPHIAPLLSAPLFPAPVRTKTSSRGSQISQAATFDYNVCRLHLQLAPRSRRTCPTYEISSNSKYLHCFLYFTCKMRLQFIHCFVVYIILIFKYVEKQN